MYLSLEPAPYWLETNKHYFDLLATYNLYPPWYKSLQLLSLYTAEQLQDISQAEEAKISQISIKYELREWFAVNHLAAISLSDWWNLPNPIKNALLFEVRQHQEEVQRAQKAQERKFEDLQASQAKNNLVYPGALPGGVGSIINS